MRLLFLVAAIGIPVVAQSQLAVRNGVLTVVNEEAEIVFDGLSVRTLRNRITDELYIAKPGPGWHALLSQSGGAEALKVGTWELRTDAAGQTAASISATVDSRIMRLHVGLAPEGEISLRLEAESSPGLRSAVWGMQGFDPKGRFVIPGQAGITFDLESPLDRLFLEYPTHWESQFLVYERGQGALLLYARDPGFTFKRLWAARDLGTLDFALEVFAKAPWASATDIPAVEWRLKLFRGNWRAAADHYRQWTRTFWPEKHRAAGLEWTEKIRGVIVIIDARPSYLESLARTLDPTRTLLYLVNWRRDSYDVNYPDYTPAEGLASFVARAHEMGFRVMLHTNALGVAQYHPAYEEVKRYQLRNPDDGSLVFWPFGIWPGGAPPPTYLPSFAFISPAASAYRRLLADALAVAVETVRPDALHLDAGGVLINDSNGEIEGRNTLHGMIQLHIDLAERFPQLAFSYESTTESLVPYQSFAQRWNSDFESHPIGTYLFGDRIHFYGFLDQENPDEPGFINYIRRYESQGILPTIRWDTEAARDGRSHVGQRVLNLLRRFQKNQFRPDWDGDWTGLQFRYVSDDGSTAASVESLDTGVRMRVGDETLYERVRRTASAETDAPVPGWPAFDGHRVIGLDPEKEYWLDEGSEWQEDRPHIAALGPAAKIGTNSFTSPEYALFELDSLRPGGFDFAKAFHSARPGILYSSYDLPALAGGSVDLTRALVRGQAKSPALLLRPPTQLRNAAIYIEYAVPIPDTTEATLHFEAAMSDFATGSDGAIVAVWVDDVRAWRAEISRSSPAAGQVSLSPWKGKTAKIRFLAHAGAAFNPAHDLVVWSDLRLELAVAPSVSLAVQLPESAKTPEISARASYDSSSRRFQLDSPVPGSVAVFTQPPPKVNRGSSLLDLPNLRWNRYYGGLAEPVEGAAGLTSAVIGGESYSQLLPSQPNAKSVRVITIAARLPEDAARLSVRAALADPPAPIPLTLSYSGVAMSVKINGEEVWSKDISTRGWNDGEIDISKWAGESVIVQLETDSKSNAIYDWAHWGGLVIN